MADRYDLATVEPRELVPGHHGKFIHSEHTTHVYWEIEEGAVLPEHSHPHEQIVNMIEGTYELSCAVVDESGRVEYDVRSRCIRFDVLKGDNHDAGLVSLGGGWQVG